jgi:hypothetical protein
MINHIIEVFTIYLLPVFLLLIDHYSLLSPYIISSLLFKIKKIIGPAIKPIDKKNKNTKNKWLQRIFIKKFKGFLRNKFSSHLT